MTVMKNHTLLTLNTFDAIVANFATGLITVDELWIQLETSYLRM